MPAGESERIAIIGSGISGLTCAHLLARRHQVSVFEAGDRIGGHTATQVVCGDARDHAIDTGFIVFNDRTYPNFNRLLDQLGVGRQAAPMGFSVSSPGGLEYSGTGFGGYFAQRRNLLNPAHYAMLRDILRFNRRAVEDYRAGRVDAGQTLGEYLHAGGYGQRFRRAYILPMVSAIWSAALEEAAAMPMLFFVRFFTHHGLLSLNDQPRWYTVPGGSASYLDPLTRRFRQRIHTRSPVESVRRTVDGVSVCGGAIGQQRFDRVVFACHSDQALALLAEPSAVEQQVLSAMGYRDNRVVLHTDNRFLPDNRRAWASWNYQLPPEGQPNTRPTLTYYMNLLQAIDSSRDFCVTVNPTTPVDPARVLGEYNCSHPVFNHQSLAAQQRWAEISGNRTHFCGAYWGNGFHEDGVVSALRVAAQFGESL